MTDGDRNRDTVYREFDRVRELVRRTRELLDAVLGEGALPDWGPDFLAEFTLPHLETVQSGFVGWLRAEGVDIAELQYLLLKVGSLRVDPAATPAERRAAVEEALVEDRIAHVRPREAIRIAEAWDLAALAHARLVLACLPRLAPEMVRWPSGRPSYADIAAPRGPAEFVERIAELERQLWRAATGHVASANDPALRRTYGFFDAAERLGERGFGLVA
ncbi:MAG: hypothetical protein ACJ77N_08160 [Chloroflexota bacterium]